MSEPALALAPGDADPARGPFRFLDPYTGTKEDQRIFAGRDQEVLDLVAGILRARTLVLYGRSGIGKTSLLLAGVVPELESRGFHVVVARVLDRPLADVRAAVAASAGRAPGREGGLGDELRAAAGGRGIVLVLDQFEELFIRFRERPALRGELVRVLAEALAEPSLDARVLFSLREDYLAEMDELRDRLPDLFTNEYRLRPLTAFGARQAISRALQRHGVPYEQRLLTGLVDALQEYGYDPTVLQILGSELYREAAAREAGPVSLEAKDLESLGGLQGIFRRYLEGLERLPSDRLLLAQAVLDRMITGERTKDALTVDDLLGSYFVAQRGEVEETLGLLIQHRLVCTLGHDRFELVHDRLVEPLRAWLERSPRFSRLRFASDVVARAVRGGAFRENPELLLTAGQVQHVVGELKERLRFSQEELELLLRSAVQCGSPEVAYWAERYGEEASPELIVQLLESGRAEIRRAAARAAGRMRDGEGRLADLCLALALNDPDEEVRRTAGASFAALRGPVQEEALAEKLRSRATRKAALEVLADLPEAERPADTFRWHWRKRAESLARERALRQHREEIHQRGASGAVYGAIAGLAYVACLFASPFWWLFWNLGAAADPESFSLLLGWSLPLGAGLGGILGWRTGASAAKSAAARRETQWPFAVWRSSSHFILLLLVCLPIVIFHTYPDEGLLGRIIPLVLAVAVWLALSALVHGLVGAQMLAAQPCFSDSRSAAGSWAWVAILSLGIPSLVPLLANVAARGWLSESGWRFPYLVWWSLFAVLWSFGSFVALSALAHSGRKLHLVPAFPPVLAGLARALAVTAFFGTLAATVVLHGFDSLPWLARPRTVGPDGIAIQGHLGPGWPDADYVRIRIGSSGIFRFDNRGQGTWKLRPLSGEPMPETIGSKSVDEVHLPAGTLHLRVENAEKPQLDRYELRIHPVEVLPPGRIGRLSHGLTTYVRVILEPSAQERHVWTGVLSGRMPPGSWKAGEVVDVQSAMPFSQLPGGDDALFELRSAGSLVPRPVLQSSSSSMFPLRSGEGALSLFFEPIKSDGSWQMDLRLVPAESWGTPGAMGDPREPIELTLGLAVAEVSDYHLELQKSRPSLLPPQHQQP